MSENHNVVAKPSTSTPPSKETAPTSQPNVVKAEPPTPIAVKIPKRAADSISISEPTEYKVAEDINQEVTPITQEALEEYWNQFIELKKDNATIVGLMQGRKIVLKTQNVFNVMISNVMIENNFRPFQNELLNYIRTQSNHPLLNMRMLVEIPKGEKKAYMPREKYEAMVRLNPAMVALKGIFNEIDF